MKTTLLLFLQLLIFNVANAQQNLVPNPSFEDTTNYQNWYNINASTPWFNPTLATPDYFSTYPGIGINIYNNSKGFHLPRTGNAFAGIYAWSGSTREYIEVELNDTLEINKHYLISYYVTRASKHYFATDALGLYVSSSSITANIATNFPFQPQIENPIGNIISDTINWVQINGIYLANGNEKYITIGNFFNNASTILDSIPSSGITTNSAYYYIDDVSVINLDSITGINETLCVNNFSIVSNPIFPGQDLSLIYNGINATFNVTIYNNVGKFAKPSTEYLFNNHDQIMINTSGLISGIYYLIINESKNKKSLVFKIIIL